MATSYLIKGAKVVGLRSIKRADIEIRDGRITKVGRLAKKSGAKVVPGDGLYALPGFVDIHVHGGAGFDLTGGVYDKKSGEFRSSSELYRESFPKVMKAFAAAGVTRALLSTVAAKPERIVEVLGYLAEYADNPLNGRDGALLEGAMIEGTFIQNPAFAGAQNPENFRKPDIALFDRFNAAARSWVKYVNVVPEYGESAVKLTRHLTCHGVLVGAGHSSCPADEVQKCVKAGLKTCIHFTNGPTGASFKLFSGGNVLEAVLTTPGITAELIADGWHVNPAYIMDILRRKGIENVIAVTDAMFATAMPQIKKFVLGGTAGERHESGGVLCVTGKANTLFGSVLTMSAAFGNFLSWFTQPMQGIWYAEHKPMKMEKAILFATRLCSTNPARLLASTVRKDVASGILKEGMAADVTLGRISGKAGEYRLDVCHTFVQGVKVC